ncbi:hypothetical protein ACH8KY_005256, partial [Salmonella enterica subsp. enterica serovar Braenderup]
SGGNITINGTSSKDGQSSIKVNNASFSADKGNISFNAEGKGVIVSYYEKSAALELRGDNLFSAKEIYLNAKNVSNHSGYGNNPYAILIGPNATLRFSGNATVNATSEYGGGILFDGSSPEGASIYSQNGYLNINATSGKHAVKDEQMNTGAIALESSYYNENVHFILNNSSLGINAKSESLDKDVGAFAGYGVGTANFVNKFIFQGNGDVNITGTSINNTGITSRAFDNTKLNGQFLLHGISTNGNGIEMSGAALDVGLSGAIINGESENGYGVVINGTSSSGNQVNLNDNVITGTSNTGTGIGINGNNVTITNGTL